MSINLLKIIRNLIQPKTEMSSIPSPQSEQCSYSTIIDDTTYCWAEPPDAEQESIWDE